MENEKNRYFVYIRHKMYEGVFETWYRKTKSSKKKKKKSLQREIEAEKRTKKKKGSCYQGSHVPIAKKRMKHNETKEIRKKLCREKSHGDRHRSSMKKEHRSKQEDNTPAQAHQ
jgi:hypothetical protein